MEKGYNYKFCEVGDVDAFIAKAKGLPIDTGVGESDSCDIDIIVPKDENADRECQPYSGFIGVWKNADMTYSIAFFFGYFCGDMFFVDERRISFSDELLKEMLKSMLSEYRKKDLIDFIIKKQEEIENG